MRIAIFTKNRSNPAYQAARVGAERAAARLGAGFEHYVPETADDPVQQSALLMRAIEDRPDAIVFTPVHPTRVNAALDQVQRAGIPLFGYISQMTPRRFVSYVGASDAALAHDIANRLFEHLGFQGEVAIVEGPPESTTSIERVHAFEAAASRWPGIRIAARCSGAYLRDPARQAFAALLAQHERIDGVLCANDNMAIGVIEAMQAATRSAPVVGVNAIPEAIAAIRVGTLLATADFDAMQMCYIATESAIRYVRGEAIPDEVTLPVALVDRSNCERWDMPFTERPLQTLLELAR